MDAVYYKENIEDLKECIEGLFDKARAYMILERIDELKFIGFDESQELDNWESGKIFDKNGEFKWRRFGGRIHGVYLGAGSPNGMTRSESSKLVKENSQDRFILWGTKVSEDQMEYFKDYSDKTIYIELKIPHIFEYPLSSPHQQRERVCLCVQKYLDEYGKLQFVRYTGIDSK